MFGISELTAVLGATPRPGADTAAWAGYGRALVDAGLPVLLIQPGTKRPADLRTSREKDGAAGVHLATTDRATVKKYVERALRDPAEKSITGHPTPYGPGAHLNWAVRLGGSGYVVVDADTPGEVAALRSFLAEHYGGENRVPGPTVTTPGTADGAHSGGGHWWFKLPEGHTVTGTAATLTVQVPGHAEGFSIYAGDAYVLIPPSIRPEGGYQLVGTDNPAPAPLMDQLTTAVATAAELAAAREERQRKAEDGELGDMEAQVAAWSQTTPWAEVLEPHGWVNTGMVDKCGCDIWTAPGTHSSPKSATTHGGMCSQMYVDPLNPPMHVWTDTPGGELEDVIRSSGSKTMSKLSAYAALEHGGNMGAALEAAGVTAGEGQTLDPAQLVEAMLPVSPEDTDQTRAGGVREDVVAALEAARPGVVKYVQDMVDRREAERLVQRLESTALALPADRDDDPDDDGESAADLLAQDDEDERWLYQDLWYEDGQVLLYAPAKVGKSRMALNVVESLTSGRKFLGRYAPRMPEGRVGLIDLEMPKGVFKARLRGLPAMDADRLWTWRMNGKPQRFNIMDPVGLAAWAARLRKRNVSVLVVDNLSVFIRAHGLDEWRDGGMVLERIQLLCAMAGVRANLVVDHASSKAGKGSNGPRGDSAKLDVVDHVWKFSPDSDNGPRPGPADRFHLDMSGRGVPDSVVLSMEGQRYVATDEIPTGYSQADKDADTLWPHVQAVLDGENLSKSELVDAVHELAKGNNGWGRDRIRAGVTALMDQGVLEARQEGRARPIRATGRSPQRPGLFVMD